MPPDVKRRRGDVKIAADQHAVVAVVLGAGGKKSVQFFKKCQFAGKCRILPRVGNIATGRDSDPHQLLESILAVTPERIQAAAKATTLDTIYFLTGKEGADHD